ELSERVAVFGRYNNAPSSTESGFAQVERFSLKSSSLTLGVAATPTADLNNDFRTNLWSIAAESAWSANPASGGTAADLSAFLCRPLYAMPTFYGIATGGLGALYSGRGGRNRQIQWNALDTLAIRRESHDIRLGIDYQRLIPSRDTASQSRMGRSNSLSALIAGISPLILDVRADEASALIETLSLFAQDTWAVSRRLNLTFGFRWEMTPPASMRQPSDASVPAFGATNLPTSMIASNEELWRSRYTQFAPRVGAAFRAGRNSVLRAGWGIFYDVAFSMALDPINGFPF